MRLFALFLGLSLATSASADTTVAVLPLEKGAGSEAYDGLGRAMAGMVTSDLARVEGIQLVERERLDALISELKLADEGFVDPATAGKLGQGLGAAWVVAGSYSVIGEQFLLSARIVDVSSGKVVNASDATGTVQDFVGVEKKLIGGLLDGLALKPTSAEQAAIAKDAPTKNLDAMRSYGLGLERKADGEDDAARRAFEAALGQDPGFSLARSELTALREVVEKRLADALAKQASETAKHQAALLARVPDERTRPATFKDDAESLGGMALRWRVLQATRLDCQRYAEMRHYLDRVKWKVEKPKDKGEAAIREGVKLAIATGLVKPPEQDNWAAHLLEGDLRVDQIGMLYSTASFVNKFPSSASVPGSPDLVNAIAACFSPAEREGELLAVRGAVLAAGQQGSRISPNDEPAVGLDERLEWAALYYRAAAIGVDADGKRRVDALLALPADERLAGWRTLRARDVANAGHAWKVEQNVRLGLRLEQIREYLPGIAASDPKVVRADEPRCKPVIDAYKGDAGRAWTAMQSPYSGEATYGGAMSVRLLADLGCLHGVHGRFATLGDVQSWLKSAPERIAADADPKCAESLKSTAQVGSTQYGTALPEEQQAQVMWSLLASELAVAMQGCVVEPAIR